MYVKEVGGGEGVGRKEEKGISVIVSNIWTNRVQAFSLGNNVMS